MKKFLAILISVVFTIALAGCGKTETPEKYIYDGTPTVGPYTVFHADGTKESDPFDSMFAAIRHAGESSTASDQLSVKDGSGLEIFKRQSLAQCWCYDGTNFVGSKPQKEALDWAEKHVRSFVYNGRGTAFVYVGTEYPTEGKPTALEQGSSGYSYLRTPHGEFNGGTWTKNGYSYASGTVRLSEATYYDTPSSQWNAYIFFNINTQSENCDLGIGLFGTAAEGSPYTGMDGQWRIFHNCFNAAHKNGQDDTGSFHIWDQTVTTMQKDPRTGIYSGADDLFIEAIGGKDTWILRVTNLATGETFGYTHTHEGMNEGKEMFFSVNAVVTLIAAMGNPWDARCGGFLKNVVWEDIKVARYRTDEIYSDADKEEFYPGLDTVAYGYTQGADCAHLTVGTHKEDGAYKSGALFKQGDKYLAYSSYYDGTHVED